LAENIAGRVELKVPILFVRSEFADYVNATVYSNGSNASDSAMPVLA
jgi:hypothetical protein